jgi:hypothetical protein
MSEKTNIPESPSQSIPEFSPSFVKWLIILTVGTLLLIVFQNPRPVQGEFLFQHEQDSKYLLNPWNVAAGYTIASGIQEFSSGDGFIEVSVGTKIRTLSGIIIGFVIAPTLFLVGWKRFYEVHSSGNEPWKVLFKPFGILTIIGGVLTVWLALSSFPVAYLQHSVFQSMTQSQAKYTSQDEIMADVAEVSRQGQLYYILPKELGGGGGSYEGFTLPDTLTFPHGIIRISSASKDSLCIEGISNSVPGAVVHSILDSSKYVFMNSSGFNN